MRVVLFAACIAAGPALADDMVARNGKDSVRLTEAACPADILATIPPQLHARVRGGSAVIEGMAYRLCWTTADGMVFMQYEDGDGGRISAGQFRREPGV